MNYFQKMLNSNNLDGRKDDIGGIGKDICIYEHKENSEKLGSTCQQVFRNN